MCPEIWMARPSFRSSSNPIKKWSAMSTLVISQAQDTDSAVIPMVYFATQKTMQCNSKLLT
ncbi:unnamed protein product [Malus baccata var. baccata]